MKKIITTCLLCLIFLVNCKDDEDDTGSLIGSWLGTNIAVIDCSDPTANSSNGLSCSATNCYLLTLNDDGTYTYQTGSRASNGDWTSSGGTLSLCIDEEGELVCDNFGIEQITATSLILATTNEATACRTLITFIRQEETESSN